MATNNSTEMSSSNPADTPKDVREEHLLVILPRLDEIGKKLILKLARALLDMEKNGQTLEEVQAAYQIWIEEECIAQ